MAKSDDSREEALKRFDERFDAAVARQTRKPMRFDTEGSGAGYRLIAELVGGVLGGLGLGWLVDRLVGTSPWGLIVGVLLGTGVSVFAIARSAGRMSVSEQTKTGGPAPSVPFDDEDDDDGPLGGPRA
ncbi:MAG TPA: AtpZ/AtpI family protein [Caulobacteraceae bacterium]|jgi:ATP synthase protein I|nr:AtpZ/AtpI family protein [Caulobacteraceae bacterium]